MEGAFFFQEFLDKVRGALLASLTQAPYPGIAGIYFSSQPYTYSTAAARIQQDARSNPDMCVSTTGGTLSCEAAAGGSYQSSIQLKLMYSEAKKFNVADTSFFANVILGGTWQGDTFNSSSGAVALCSIPISGLDESILSFDITLNIGTAFSLK